MVDIGTHQRLSPGKEENRNPKVHQIVDDSFSALGIYLSGLFLIVGAGIAVDAAQVTPLGAIPDHYRPGYLFLLVPQMIAGTGIVA